MSDVWFVRTANGEARMTLDEFDAAFQAGSIDERTQVREENALQWSTLGALLGIEPQEAHSNSVRPLAVDLDDIDEAQLKPKKRGVVIAIAAGAIVLGGIALAVTQFGGAAPAVEKAAAAGGGQAAVVITPAVTTPDPAAQPKLTDEQKKALEKADKDLAAKQAAKQQEFRDKHPSRQYRPQDKSGPVFQKGGSKFDPLNTNL